MEIGCDIMLVWLDKHEVQRMGLGKSSPCGSCLMLCEWSQQELEPSSRVLLLVLNDSQVNQGGGQGVRGEDNNSQKRGRDQRIHEHQADNAIEEGPEQVFTEVPNDG